MFEIHLHILNSYVKKYLNYFSKITFDQQQTI